MTRLPLAGLRSGLGLPKLTLHVLALSRDFNGGRRRVRRGRHQCRLIVRTEIKHAQNIFRYPNYGTMSMSLRNPLQRFPAPVLDLEP